MINISIGMFDKDLKTFKNSPFNLELMKLSTYFKDKGEIVTLVPTFSPEKHQKFYYWQDYFTDNITEKITQPNITIGGRAFTNDVYKPLKEEVERQKPDVFLYSKMNKRYYDTKVAAEGFRLMTNAVHLRLSLDEKKVWEDFYCQVSKKGALTIFLHDKNLNDIEGAKEAVDFLFKKNQRKNTALATKYPIIVNNYKDLEKWLSIRSSLNYYTIIYQGIMKDTELIDLMKKPSRLINKVQYNVGYGCSDENLFLKRDLPKIFRQVIFLKKRGHKILLYCEEEKFKEKRIPRLIQFFNAYLKSLDYRKMLNPELACKYDTMYSFADAVLPFPPDLRKMFNKQEVRFLFNFIREVNPKLFVDLYECRNVYLKGDEFVTDVEYNRNQEKN